MSIRDTILNAEDRPAEIVDVPEWEVKLEVRGLSAGEAIDFYDSATRREAGETVVDRKKWAPGLLVACCYDPESGERVFDAADVEAIGRKSSAAVTRVSQVAARLSGLGGTVEDRQVAEDFD